MTPNLRQTGRACPEDVGPINAKTKRRSSETGKGPMRVFGRTGRALVGLLRQASLTGFEIRWCKKCWCEPDLRHHSPKAARGM